MQQTASFAIGVQMAIILAGIDLTGGALAALSGVMTVAAFQWWGFPVQLAVLMGILIGVVIGLLNGVIVAYTGIHPFVVTLAMQSLLSWYCLSGSKRISCNSLW